MPLCTFTPLWKEERKKNEETQSTFEGSYLRNAWCDLVEIWNVRWWRWPAFSALKSFSFIKVSRSYVYVKIALLFFLLITHWCGALASWAARHTTVCVIIFFMLLESECLVCVLYYVKPKSKLYAHSFYNCIYNIYLKSYVCL